MATHKIELHLTDDELEMLASLFNTVTICEMNADEPLRLTNDLHPPINKFLNWHALCKHLRTEFNFKNGMNKYPTAITRALKVRFSHKS
jgi:hypothetical protein